MSAYLKFFELEQSPFEGKAQSQVVLGTRAVRDALAEIQSGLDEGAARICVNGGRGFGKTSLARALPKLLDETTNVAIVLDPTESWESQRGSLARQWGLEHGGLPRAGLLEASREGRLVLVIDQAESASEEFLDHLDVLLSYRSEDDQPVVQSVLLACLSATEGREPAPLIWWLDRIQTLQLEFAPLPREGVASYIKKHLKRAGWRGPRLFSPEAALAIHGYTGGIPGEVSKLCERLLAEAAESDLREIDADFVHALCDDHEVEDTSNLEDEFGELVLAEEFEDAAAESASDIEGPTGVESLGESAAAPIELVEPVGEAERQPSLSETLEHFEADPRSDASPFESGQSVGIDDDMDVNEAGPGFEEESEPGDSESFDGLEDYLSSPPSAAELRSIHGTLLARHGRALAAAAAAAVIGGLFLSWLSGGEPPPAPRTSESGLEAKASDPAPSVATPTPEGLARLRGPVPKPGIDLGSLAPSPRVQPASAESLEPAPVEPVRLDDPAPTGVILGAGLHGAEPTQPDAIAGVEAGFDLDLDDSEQGVEITEDDLVDMRPAAMRPDAGARAPGSE